ncbi:MAG: hypothetical protein IH933_12485 [Euryarchaeota archaeon]|nr:hypothetical protein [Euryarchaeota archaeon]
MDTSKQLYEQEATGWKRGLYDDIKHTFRAPIVNWIFRTVMANHPDFLRYAWGQLQPTFRTRGFARFSVAYRATVLSTIENTAEIPTYRYADLDVSPAEYRELRGQLASFDIVAPRLAVLFELADRALHDRPIGTEFEGERATTAPFPDWLDRDRGRSPTMIDAGAVPETLSDTLETIRDFHGLDDGLPSIYRCLAQWPSLLEPMWDDLEPTMRSDAFSDACERVEDAIDGFADTVPYTPRLDPASLRVQGFDDETIDELGELFRSFNRGPIETVLPTLPIYAATVDAVGERSFQ